MIPAQNFCSAPIAVLRSLSNAQDAPAAKTVFSFPCWERKKGSSDRGNLFYDFEENLSLAGLFQRIDNFLAKGLDESIERQRENARQEKAELETVKAALGKEFPQQEELALARENHSAVIRELQRMQDDSSYVSTWTPKTSLTDEQPTTAEAPQPKEDSAAAAPPEKTGSHAQIRPKVKEERNTQSPIKHNGYTLQNWICPAPRLFQQQASVPWGKVCTRRSVAQHGDRAERYETQAVRDAEAAIQVARNDAAQRGLEKTSPAEPAAPVSALDGETVRERLARAGFHPTDSDFYGKNDHSRTMDAGDGGIFQMRIFQTADNQTGLHVQYEKYNLIDCSRTVDTQFDTLDKALEFVGRYETLAERPAAPVPEETHVRGMVFSSRPRMR